VAKHEKKARDSARAKFMKDFPNRFPSSVDRERVIVKDMAKYGPTSEINNSRFMSGMFGGVVCAQMGMAFVGQQPWIDALKKQG